MNTIVTSTYNQIDVVTAFIDNKLEFISLVRDSELGNIYVGKVDNIVKNIDGAFIRYEQDKMGYLPISFVNTACILNRDASDDKKIKNGDEILVQVESEAVKTKKCKLTTGISISGKYCVVTLGRKGVGASVKIKEPLRGELISFVKKGYEALLDEYMPLLRASEFGILIRTECSRLNESDYNLINDDLRDVLEKFKSIFTVARNRKIYSCLYSKISPDHSKNTDISIPFECNDKIKGHIYKAVSFIRNRNNDEILIKEDNGIDGIKSKIDDLLKNKVYLKSGAYLIIEQLESFNAIDVNTGKAIKGKDNISLKVNLEAAEEIMKQVRLRNLTGMILIDFINMKSKEDEELLIKRMKELCVMDPVHTTFIDITGLGIMELTRNKNDKTLREILASKS